MVLLDAAWLNEQRLLDSILLLGILLPDCEGSVQVVHDDVSRHNTDYGCLMEWFRCKPNLNAELELPLTLLIHCNHTRLADCLDVDWYWFLVLIYVQLYLILLIRDVEEAIRPWVYKLIVIPDVHVCLIDQNALWVDANRLRRALLEDDLLKVKHLEAHLDPLEDKLDVVRIRLFAMFRYDLMFIRMLVEVVYSQVLPLSLTFDIKGVENCG